VNSGKQLSEFWLAKSSEPRKLSLNSKKTRLSNCKLAERLLQNATVIGTYAYNIYIYIRFWRFFFPCKRKFKCLCSVAQAVLFHWNSIAKLRMRTVCNMTWSVSQLFGLCDFCCTLSYGTLAQMGHWVLLDTWPRSPKRHRVTV